MIKANEKTKAGLHTVSLLESLHVMLATPKLLTDAAIGLVCASLRELYELVRLNPLNNILHGLVVRVTKQVGYVYQGQPSRMLAFLDTMVAVLLTFNESLFRDEPCGRAGYAGHMLQVSEWVLSVMESCKYEKNSEWAAYELALCRLLAGISELRVGAYTMRPHYLPIVYSRGVYVVIVRTLQRHLRVS
jgi:hypothetical protein